MSTQTDNRLPERVAVLEDWRDRKDQRDEDIEDRLRIIETAKWKMSGGIALLAVLGATIGARILDLLIKKVGG